jgi:hypothetical protein
MVSILESRLELQNYGVKVLKVEGCLPQGILALLEIAGQRGATP